MLPAARRRAPGAIALWCCLVAAVHTVAEPMYVDDDVVFFVVHSPAAIRYVFRGTQAKDFGGVFTRKFQNIHLIPAEPADGCQAFENSDVMAGQVALVKRGVCSFVEKAAHAQSAGAAVVMIYDNNEENYGDWVDMVKEGYDWEVTIPSLYLAGRDGANIVRAITLDNAASAVISLPLNESGIAVYDFTPWTAW